MPTSKFQVTEMDSIHLNFIFRLHSPLFHQKHQPKPIAYFLEFSPKSMVLIFLNSILS